VEHTCRPTGPHLPGWWGSLPGSAPHPNPLPVSQGEGVVGRPRECP